LDDAEELVWYNLNYFKPKDWSYILYRYIAVEERLTWVEKLNSVSNIKEIEI
jgi:hypothetical protein